MPNTPVSNFSATLQDSSVARLSAPVSASFTRLWQVIMNARVLLALALLALGQALAVWNRSLPGWALWLCALYLAATIAVRLLARPRGPGRAFDRQALYVVGVDLVCFLPLNLQSIGSINFTTLLAFPVLAAAMLGSRLLAMGTAALVALLLTGDALIEASRIGRIQTAEFAQAALAGSALLALGWLTSLLSTRLAREEARAYRSGEEVRIQQALTRRSQDDALIQAWVNGMVIESLSDGILVVDAQHTVHAANPAAYQMLGSTPVAARPVFSLDDDPDWHGLAELADQTFAQGSRAPTEITLVMSDDQGERHLRAHTERTPALGQERSSLCVMFLQDMRELQAQLLTEKLAAMGRMSAAVAHEIRNPLAAIAQANALLAEDLPDPAAQRLTAIVRQNTERLGHIVDDVLDLARVRGQGRPDEMLCAPLDELTLEACRDWASQHAVGPRLTVVANAPGVQAQFSPEHLRRVLVNLLDNAARYASGRPGAIQVETDATGGPPLLSVWSDGAPLEPSVQSHLFEPFFSSESRSSGLGLYICRELCERHGAAIAYQRVTSTRDGETVEGNAFAITFCRALAGMSGNAAPELLDRDQDYRQNPASA